TYGYVFSFVFWEVSKLEWFLRLPSVLFSILNLFVFFAFTKKYFNKKIALLGLFIFAISPLDIYYSQEARTYTLLTLLTFASSVFLFQAVSKGKIKYWIAYAFFCCLATYTHYITAFIIFSQFLFVMVNFEKIRRQISFSRVMVILLLLVCLAPFFIQIINVCYFVVFHGSGYDFGRVLSYVPSVNIVNIFYTFKNLSAGYNIQSSLFIFFSPAFMIPFFYGFYRLIKKEDKLRSSFILLHLIFPLFVFLVSQWKVIYIDRHFLPVMPYFNIVLAYGLVSVRRKSKGVFYIFLAVIIFSAGTGLFNYYQGRLPAKGVERLGVQSKKDIRAAAEYVAEDFKGGDIIIHTCDNTIYPFMYYFKVFGKCDPGRIYLEFINDSPQFIEKKIWPVDTRKEGIFYCQNTENQLSDERKLIDQDTVIDQINFSNYENIWLVLSSFFFPYEYQEELPEHEGNIERWFSQRFRRIKQKKFKGISIYKYRID
ncbi:MAG: hypothetical protein GF375_06290, partial [Candidatus Omnitrophica bacterium]|nr:hypothetical protein [Candidatus Omnitrophota bacterium]MBD3269585.1 hypothetical protein [Candidatus Omnitrophota bacterium]